MKSHSLQPLLSTIFTAMLTLISTSHDTSRVTGSRIHCLRVADIRVRLQVNVNAMSVRSPERNWLPLRDLEGVTVPQTILYPYSDVLITAGLVRFSNPFLVLRTE